MPVPLLKIEQIKKVVNDMGVSVSHRNPAEPVNMGTLSMVLSCMMDLIENIEAHRDGIQNPPAG